jgi:hypothetical protein
MGDRSNHAKEHASMALHQLLTVGAVEVLEEARGRRPRLVRLCPIKKKRDDTKGATAPPFKKGEIEVKEQQAAAAANPPPTDEEKTLAEEAHATLGASLPVEQAVKLIQKHGAEVVRRQLEWLPARDTSGFKKGPVVAFRVYCRDNEPAPPESEANKRARVEREYQAKLQAIAAADEARWRARRN